MNVLFEELKDLVSIQDNKDIVIINNIPFHRYVLFTVQYFKKIGLELPEFSEEVIKQFQLCLYEQKVEPKNDILDKETFILFDFLSLDIPKYYEIGGKRDYKKVKELFWKNWEENKNNYSLYHYAEILQNGIDGEEDLVKARELHWKNWEENKNSNSLHSYAYMLEHGLGGEKKREISNRIILEKLGRK